jgi:hypothetical protein
MGRQGRHVDVDHVDLQDFSAVSSQGPGRKAWQNIGYACSATLLPSTILALLIFYHHFATQFLLCTVIPILCTLLLFFLVYAVIALCI